MDGGGGVSLLINDTVVLSFWADHVETSNLACAQARIGPLEDKVRPCILRKITRLIVLFLFTSEVPSFIAHAPKIATHFIFSPMNSLLLSNHPANN